MHSIFVKIDGKYKGILFAEILYVEAFKNYVRIHTVRKVYVTHNTLKQVEEHLPTQLFCRIHKSYVIALDKLTDFDHDSVTLDKIQLPLTSQYTDTLKSKLNVVCNKKKSKLSVVTNGSVFPKN